MLPETEIVVGDGLSVGLFAGGALVEGAHATSRTTATTRNAALMFVEPQTPESNSDVRAGLPTVHGDARAIEKACLLRADERDHVGDLLHDAKSPEWHLGAHEGVNPFRIRLLPPIPAAALPQNRTRSDTIDGHALRGDLAGERRGEADLGGLGGVVRRSSSRLASIDGRDDDHAAPVALEHARQHELRHARADPEVAGECRFELRGPGIRPRAAGAHAEVVDEDVYRPEHLLGFADRAPAAGLREQIRDHAQAAQ